MEALPRLVGGDVALDFVNTVDDELPGGDYLQSDADVAEWLRLVGLTGAARLRDARAVRRDLDAVLRPLAAAHGAVAPAPGATAHAPAAAAPAPEGAVPHAAALDALRRREATALGWATLTTGGWGWGAPLDPLVHAATELILHGPVDRLRTCGHCPWLFLDLSRNGSRRWCSMEGCGSEVKSRRLTERRRAARGRRAGA